MRAPFSPASRRALLALALLLTGCADESAVHRFAPRWELLPQGASDQTPEDVRDAAFRPVDSVRALRGTAGSGYVWLRTKFDCPRDILSRAPLAIYAGRPSWADRTFVNGEAVGGEGRFGPHAWNAWNRFRVYSVPAESLRPRDNELYMLVYLEGRGGVHDAERLMLGARQAVERSLDPWNYLYGRGNMFSAALFVVIGVYFLALYGRRRKESEHLWYGLFSLGYSCFSVAFFNQLVEPIDFHYVYFDKYVCFFSFLLAWLFFRFILAFLHVAAPRWLHAGVLALAAAPVLITLPLTDYALQEDLRNAMNGLILPVIGVVLFYTTREAIRDSPDARPALLGLLPMLAAVIHDILVAPLDLPTPFLFSAGLSAYLCAMLFILAGRSARVHTRVEELNETLEQKVEERTRELESSLQESQRLKRLQDGDYYLTSLILEPLSGGEVESEASSVRLLIDQNKKFEFNGKRRELGGDICIARNVELRNRSFTVFANGDAMGKSLQGAGGAIVMGTVLRGILDRTTKRRNARTLHPDRWLFECYQELNEVFQTFQGSMYMSAIVGLLDNARGLVYFWNADHPTPVLLREGRASFLKGPLMQKLGFPESAIENEFCLQAAHLHPGDVLMLGSDGRDDLLVGHTREGSRLINEDDSIFRDAVIAGAGDPLAIRRALEEQGEFTDDLSLLSLSYSGAPPHPELPEDLRRAALQTPREGGGRLDYLERLRREYPDSLRLLHLFAHECLAAGRNAAAAVALEELCALQADADAFYRASILLRRAGQVPLARAFAERGLFFDPRHVENLINLADILLSLNQRREAQRLTERARALDPGHALLQRFSRLLEDRNRLAASVAPGA